MDLKAVSLDWLKTQALPLWLGRGRNEDGGFEEAITLTGVPHAAPRRAMVQARQIYAVRTALRMGLLDEKTALPLLEEATEFLLKHFGRPDGSFIHSVRPDLVPNNETPDLYTQAFAIFGLAQAFAELRDTRYKARARAVAEYLKHERHLPQGGYSEFAKDGTILYQSNPHMHLFEAYVAWLEVDDDPHWRRDANEILDLALTRMIDPATKLLGEHFDADWKHLRQPEHFIWEPGHQFEWAWLMDKYQHVSKISLADPIASLLMNAERFGIDPASGVVRDEMWSDFTSNGYRVKSPTSRFWPQCERIKACIALGLPESADQGMEALLRFFVTPTPGLWFDRMNPDGSFHQEPARASSLYHIIGALSEYQKL